MTPSRNGHRTGRVVALGGGAASAGFDYDLAGAVEWEILSVAFRLVTAAGGGNRQVVARLLEPTGDAAFTVVAPAVQAGGLTVDYSFAPDVPAAGSAALGALTGPFVGGRLPENLTVAVAVTGTAAGDRLSRGWILARVRDVT